MKTNGSFLTFGYDAMGQRVRKTVHTPITYNSTTAYNQKSTFYVRDAQGNVMSVYTNKRTYKDDGDVITDTLKWAESHIYGSARLGMNN